MEFLLKNLKVVLRACAAELQIINNNHNNSVLSKVCLSCCYHPLRSLYAEQQQTWSDDSITNRRFYGD